jgi:hypothetical protein
MKPVELVDGAIRNSRKSRHTILDPFGGSGATLIACEKDRSPRATDRTGPAVLRCHYAAWMEFTGRKANPNRRSAVSPQPAPDPLNPHRPVRPAAVNGLWNYYAEGAFRDWAAVLLVRK